MRILTVSPDQYERNRSFLKQMHRLRATVFGAAWNGKSPLQKGKSATSTMVTSRPTFWRLPIVDLSQAAPVFFRLSALRCWSRLSPAPRNGLTRRAFRDGRELALLCRYRACLAEGCKPVACRYAHPVRLRSSNGPWPMAITRSSRRPIFASSVS